jgi:Protein of unknown function C-terminal (DUF3324)/Bacterial protein of unknown function (DUF916)
MTFMKVTGNRVMIQGSIAGLCHIFLAVGLLFHPSPSLPSSTPTAIFTVSPIDYAPPQDHVSYFIFAISPGQTFQSQVLITNQGNVPGTATISAVDALTGPTSGIVYEDRSAACQDVGSWIVLDETKVTLQPGEKHVVHFRGTIPQRTWIGQHVGGIVIENDALGESSAQNNIQVKVRQQAIVAVEIDNPGANVEQLALSEATFDRANEQQVLALHLQNTGEVFLEPAGSVVIADSSNITLQTTPIKMEKVLPHSSFAYPIAIKDNVLPPGKYQVHVTLIYGKTKKTLHSTIPFTVSDQSFTQTYGNKAKLYLSQSRTP